MNYETAKEIELAIALRWYSSRDYLMVPNISWGLRFYDREIDLLVITSDGYATEVEIKISRPDLVRDRQKRHSHRSVQIRRLFFAIPRKLEKHIGLIPEHAGILIVDNNGSVTRLREPVANPLAKRMDNKDLLKLGKLGTMRMWNLKDKEHERSNRETKHKILRSRHFRFSKLYQLKRTGTSATNQIASETNTELQEAG